jgi:ubiquitin-protein ligase
MNKTSKQLEAVFQEITDSFGNRPDIIVTPGEGTPPDEYTVTYHRKGICKEDDATVSTCDTHVISITLPFGFPHFPPNCIPKSNTFHPDFDSSAICIGDAWEANQSITDLILHIGRMISGEFYSEASAFNEEAAEWYKANSNSLPFKKLESKQETVATPEAAAEEESFDTIDTLDDDLGQTLSLVQDTPPDAGFNEEQIRRLASHKRFHALSQELQKIGEPFEGRSDLEGQTQLSLNGAAAFFHEAEQLEHQGKQQEALVKLHSVEELVSDYPNLQKAKKRIQQAVGLLDGGANETQHDFDDDPNSDEPVTTPSDSADSQASKRSFFEDKKLPPRKGLLLILGGGIFALTATLVFSYFFLGSNLKKAGEHFTECQNLLKAGNFKGAEQKCKKALELAAEVQVVKQGEKQQLTRDIRALLNSPKLRQGLAGNTLLNGKYVSQASRDAILKFMESKKIGDAFFLEELWQDASLSYEKALAIAKKTEINKVLLAEILERQPLIRFNAIRQAGEESLAKSDWKSATEHFNEALKLGKTSPHFLPEDIEQLELLAQQTQFNALRTHAQELFNNKQWNEALDTYQRALALAKKLDLTKADMLSDLQRNIARTKIYLAIEKGTEAFDLAQWDTAIAQYEKAILLLEEKARLLGDTTTQENRIKLARIMLHTTIIRDKQGVAVYLESADFNQAIKKLQTIKQSIISSKYADQPEFQTILKEILSQIKDTEKKVLLIRQTAYLTENYKKLFLKHYPAAGPSMLSAPGVEYLRDIDNKLLFRIQCTETTGGRPLRLQMDYLYSLANDSWQFYSEE